jgi:lysyl-tRNA synthetase class I
MQDSIDYAYDHFLKNDYIPVLFLKAEDGYEKRDYKALIVRPLTPKSTRCWRNIRQMRRRENSSAGYFPFCPACAKSTGRV